MLIRMGALLRFRPLIGRAKSKLLAPAPEAQPPVMGVQRGIASERLPGGEFAKGESDK